MPASVRYMSFNSAVLLRYVGGVQDGYEPVEGLDHGDGRGSQHQVRYQGSQGGGEVLRQGKKDLGGGGGRGVCSVSCVAWGVYSLSHMTVVV